jgi:4-alpha-glucanotransferase
MNSASWLALFQITDVFGMTARFNTPGSVGAANWSYRLPQTVREFETDPVLARRSAQFSRIALESNRG